MPIGRLHVLTDCRVQGRYSHSELARLASEGGADVVQFREKEGTASTKRGVLNEMLSVLGGDKVQLIVNDHVDLALHAGADGVHLGQDDMPAEIARGFARRASRPDLIFGVTCTTSEQARIAEMAGATYIGFGPVFPTTSKENPASVKGLDGLAEACSVVRIPVVAIGGIELDRVKEVLETGAHGIAVMSAIVAADDVRMAARAFRAELDNRTARES